ncbi:hypothetical protein [Mycobacterium sp.]|jgi:hypothetical protein|uniref:hypothetical protein n=1 Tax=Mycobacterium sp. TaxID=1785 RepID=UPI00333E7F12
MAKPSDHADLLVVRPTEVGRNLLVVNPVALEQITCTTPLTPGPLPHQAIERVRDEMRSIDTTTPIERHPLVDRVGTMSLVIRDGLQRYISDADPGPDHIYVLDFQGPGQWQYIMFGHSLDPLFRITEHIRAAEVHGWVLVDGWISPGVTNAQPLEAATLNVAGIFHQGLHYRERFYTMRFKDGLKIARVMFEVHVNDAGD